MNSAFYNFPCCSLGKILLLNKGGNFFLLIARLRIRGKCHRNLLSEEKFFNRKIFDVEFLAVFIFWGIGGV
jgi:hypothetical protein